MKHWENEPITFVRAKPLQIFSAEFRSFTLCSSQNKIDISDNDDFVLSQALDLFKCSTTFNGDNVTQDDLFLSQTLSEIDRDAIFNDIDLLTSSQMVNFVNDVQLSTV